jgi:hypothetical protein
MNCHEFEENLALYLYEELSPEQRAECEAHVAGCATCRAALEEVRRLHAVLGQRPAVQPSPELIVACRQALEEALDREQLGWQGLLREWFTALHLAPASGMALAVAVLVLGFGLGWTLRPRVGSVPASPAGVVSSSLSGLDLSNLRISGISHVAPDPRTGEVRITMDAERRVTLEGSLDDPRIQQVLVYAVKSYDNAGIRRDTLDALRARSNNPTFRQALLYAMQHDKNVGMRLEALDAVRGLEWGPDLTQAFLDTVQHDANPGMRVAAIDVLARHADETVLPTLRRVASSDSCRYVRLKSTSAVMELGK